MPITSAFPNSSWTLTESDYGSLFGSEYSLVRGGVLTVQDVNTSRSIPLDYISVRRRYSRRIGGIDQPPELESYDQIFDVDPDVLSWWQVRSQTVYRTCDNTGICLTPADPGDPLAEPLQFYLGIDGSTVNPFESLTSSIRLQTSNPGLDDQIFGKLLNSSYQVQEVTVSYKGSEDNFSPASVPEPHLASELLFLGLAGLAVFIKRTFKKVA